MSAPTSKHKTYVDIMIKLFICIFAAAFTIYAYIEKQNELTGLRIAIPTLAKELRQINEENIRLKYEIDQFESPIHLIELSRKPEFGHLKYPHVDDVIILNEGMVPVESGVDKSMITDEKGKE